MDNYLSNISIKESISTIGVLIMEVYKAVVSLSHWLIIPREMWWKYSQ